MSSFVRRRGKAKTERGVMLLGVDLQDAREEVFVRMVCDGIALGVAFRRAGFESKNKMAASNLFNLPRVQERANAILEARRTTGVVSLGEVTDMLQRVFAGAHAAEEYSAAHNAAFSLARIYGHVTDRASIEVIRRPSRDPDAPSEQALSSWVEALPALPGPGPAVLGEPSFLRLPSAEPGLQESPEILPSRGAPADLLGLEPSSHDDSSAPIAQPAGPGPSERELSNDINWLEPGPEVAGRPENGAPSRPVTGTPKAGARSELLGPDTRKLLGPKRKTRPTPTKKKRVPPKKKKVPVKKRVKIPSAEDLF